MTCGGCCWSWRDEEDRNTKVRTARNWEPEVEPVIAWVANMTSTTLAFLHGVILQAGPERHNVAREDGENPDVLDTTFYVTQHNAPRSRSCISGNVICEAASRVVGYCPTTRHARILLSTTHTPLLRSWQSSSRSSLSMRRRCTEPELAPMTRRLWKSE